MNLKDGEIIIQEIEHSNKIPFRLEDLIRMPFAIIFMVFFVLIFDNKEGINKDLFHFFLIPLIVLFLIYLTIGRIFIRWYVVKSSRFFLTNKRLIFVDLTGRLINKSFDLSNVPLSCRESVNGNGYIIIGKTEPLFQGRGINLFEDKDVMYNLKNVKKVYEEIKIVNK